ncbi:MAG: biotin/lipoyl-containing protein [Bryobacteraceae bacterium]
MKFKRLADGGLFDVEILAHKDSKVQVRVNGEERLIEVVMMPDQSALLSLNGSGLRVAAARQRDSILVAAGPLACQFVPVAVRRGRAAHGLATPELTAPMPGKVLKVLVEEGQRVEPGQPLVMLEAMKMETALAAEAAAIVKKIHVAAGQMVDHGAVLLELSPAPASGEVPVQGL